MPYFVKLARITKYKKGPKNGQIFQIVSFLVNSFNKAKSGWFKMPNVNRKVPCFVISLEAGKFEKNKYFERTISELFVGSFLLIFSKFL